MTLPTRGPMSLCLSFLYASYNGAAVVTLTEVVPLKTHTIGFSVAYSLATTLGGFTPAFSTYLVHTLANDAAPALFAIAAAAFGLCRTLMLLPGPHATQQKQTAEESNEALAT